MRSHRKFKLTVSLMMLLILTVTPLLPEPLKEHLPAVNEASATGSLSRTSTGKLLLDTFDSGLGNFGTAYYTAGSGTIAIEGNELSFTKTVANGLCYYPTVSSWTNLTVRTSFNIKGSGNNQIGILARYQDSSNFYVARLVEDTVGVVRVWRIEKVVSGVLTTLAERNIQTNADNNPQVDKWYRIAFEVKGSTLKAWFEGFPSLSATDSAITSSGKSGYLFGFGYVPSSHIHTDNFGVYTDPTITINGVSSGDIVEVSGQKVYRLRMARHSNGDSSEVQFFHEFNNKLYLHFGWEGKINGTLGNLWSYDGNSFTMVYLDPNVSGNSRAASWASITFSVDGLMYYVGEDFPDANGRAVVFEFNGTTVTRHILPNTADTNELVSVAEFNNKLYAGERGAGGFTGGSNDTNGGRLWRSSDGDNWYIIKDFGSQPVVAQAVYNNVLYLAVSNMSKTSPGVKIYTMSTSEMFTSVANLTLYTELTNQMFVFDNKLVIVGGDGSSQAKLYYYDGSTWTPKSYSGGRVFGRGLVRGSRLYITVNDEFWSASTSDYKIVCTTDLNTFTDYTSQLTSDGQIGYALSLGYYSQTPSVPFYVGTTHEGSLKDFAGIYRIAQRMTASSSSVSLEYTPTSFAVNGSLTIYQSDGVTVKDTVSITDVWGGDVWSYTAPSPPAATHTITISGSPEIASKFTVNGTSYQTPQVKTWYEGWSQTITYVDTSGWTFVSWSSSSLGAQTTKTITYTVPTSDETITLTVKSEDYGSSSGSYTPSSDQTPSSGETSGETPTTPLGSEPQGTLPSSNEPTPSIIDQISDFLGIGPASVLGGGSFTLFINPQQSYAVYAGNPTGINVVVGWSGETSITITSVSFNGPSASWMATLTELPKAEFMVAGQATTSTLRLNVLAPPSTPPGDYQVSMNVEALGAAGTKAVTTRPLTLTVVGSFLTGLSDIGLYAVVAIIGLFIVLTALRSKR